ncbi:MAG: glycosyltransferase family 4 protein [Acidobacteria bacterium]|nr:glycosyltransferase family 4 protein [Acidobacteriota bacterium]MBU4405694.1 glycosyltransferase family 4 protein [Acidobacteriota bacterium]MCG2811177.1 glycosyltransferase family 4 protein [Candidatus Aminicenantes bacterium]
MISILYISNTAKMSGAEFSLLSLLKGINRKQFRPVLLLPEEGLFAERARELGIELHIIPSMIRFGEAYFLSSLPRVLKTIKQIVKIIQRQQIQIVHANSPRAAYIGGLAGRLAGVITLTHVRDIDQSPFSSLTKSRILGFLSDKIITVSKATADAILKVNPSLRSKTEVVYNGIDIGEIELKPKKEIRSRLGIPPAVKLIGSVGIIHPAKGQDILIRAAARIKAVFPFIKVLLIGEVFHPDDAGYKIKLEKLAAELGIIENIVFTGFRNDVFDLIQVLDIFVHPAIFQDPLPRTLLEAAAFGKTIVATKTGGIPEIIDNNISGILVAPGDVDTLAEVVISLLQNPYEAERLGLAARKKIERSFSIQQHIAAVTAIYQSLGMAKKTSRKNYMI